MNEISEKETKLLDLFKHMVEEGEKYDAKEAEEVGNALSIIAASYLSAHQFSPILYQSFYPIIWQAVALGYLLGKKE